MSETYETYEGVEPTIKHPYRWVVLWALLLVMVGFGFWYMVLFDGPSIFSFKLESESEVVVVPGESYMDNEELMVLIRASSAPSEEPPALSETELEVLLIASSAEAEVPPALSESELEELLRFSSASSLN